MAIPQTGQLKATGHKPGKADRANRAKELTGHNRANELTGHAYGRANWPKLPKSTQQQPTNTSQKGVGGLGWGSSLYTREVSASDGDVH